MPFCHIVSILDDVGDPPTRYLSLSLSQSAHELCWSGEFLWKQVMAIVLGHQDRAMLVDRLNNTARTTSSVLVPKEGLKPLLSTLRVALQKLKITCLYAQVG